MGAAKKLIDKKVLRDLVPINALSAVHIQEISRKAIIEDVRSGTYVFKAGDRDYQTVYLLEGTVEFVDAGRNVVETVSAGAELARHPLAPKQPRQLGVRADGNVTVARIDSSLLDVLLTWDESAGYDVVEIDANEGDDWMTRMLQSQAFLQLPPSNIHQLLMRLEPVTGVAGDLIVRQGEEGDYFYIVKSGRLAVTRKASARSKEVLLAELGEGACFGEEALVSGTKRNASVMMVTDGSLMRLSKQDFNELLCAPLVHEADFEGAQKLVAKGARWLDVRLPGEFENQAIKGSFNLPLSALRDQCGELDLGTDYIVCCDTGRRSAAGAFVLSQRGFSVYTLKNGLMDVPDEELTRVRSTGATSAGKSSDADIIPFEADARPENTGTPETAPAAGQGGEQDTVLIDKLAAAEAEKLVLSRQLGELQEKLDQSGAQIQVIAEKQQEAQSELERMQSESGELRGELRSNEQALLRKVARAEQEKDSLQTELEALRTDVQFNLRKYESVDNEKRALEDELSRLQQTLAQIQQSAEGRDDALRGELEQMAGRLENERQSHDKRLHELEAELARVREDYRQLGQRTSSVAGERDAATRELEAVKGQLDDLNSQLENSQKSLLEVNGQLADSAEKTLAEQTQVSQLQAQLAASEEQREALQAEHAQELDRVRKELEQAQNEAAAGKDGMAQQLDALQQELDDQRRQTEAQQSACEVLGGQLADSQQAVEASARKAQEQLEQQQAAHAEEATGLQRRLDELQEQLSISLEQVKTLEERLADERVGDEQATADYQQQIETAAAKIAELEAALTAESGQREQSEKRAAELDEHLNRLNKEHETDVASTRKALSRAQMETENVKREEARLTEKVRKLERDLERGRHDHEAEVRRLHKEMKEAAGGSGDGLAAELEALQQKIAADTKERDDLEIKLGERSAQFESIQAEAEHLAVQLDQARESARQAEQQLLDSTQAANQEMTVRMEAEEKAQLALRNELAETIAERNQSQEQLTVQMQELEELRTAVETAHQQISERDKSIATAERERDEAQEEQCRIQQAVDQLRAEAEVTRGLVDMAAPTDEALREQLEQATKNVDVAVRLRVQAEDRAAALQREVEHLTEALGSGAEAASLPDGHIPSLDENDPQAAVQLNPDYAVDELLGGRGASVLLEDDEESRTPVTRPPDTEAGATGGGWKGLIAGLLTGACVAGGGVWWMFTQGPDAGPDKRVSALESDRPSRSEIRATASAPKSSESREVAPATRESEPPKPEASEKTVQVESVNNTAPAQAPASMPSFSKGSSRVSTTELDMMVSEAAEPVPVDAEAKAEVAEAAAATVKAAPPKKQPVRTFSESLAGGGRAPLMAEFQADGFLMGSGLSSPHFDERPQHRVDLKRFAMSKREVTFAEYERFARDSGRKVPNDAGWGRGERPVINVSWADAVAYTRWLSEQTGSRYRLPTEAEWEFVARAGRPTRFWWGNEVGEGHANCFDCNSRWSGRETAPAGSFPASPFGVHDLAGNVMEWVEDCYSKDYSKAPADGSAFAPAGCDQRVVRGGAYTSASDSVRSASRDSRDAGARLDNLGFRIVKEY